MKVSIIITYYNYGQYIADCIQSCIEQNYENKEIIIVDDASTDNGLEFLGEIDFSNIVSLKIITHKTNKGIAEAKNTGIKNATGDLITFIDADDMLTRKSIFRRVKVFKENPELEFVHGYAYRVKGDYTFKKCLKKKFKLHGKWETVNAQTMMFRKEVFEKFGLFYSLYSKEDKEMTYRLGIHPNSPLPTVVNHKKLKFGTVSAYYRVHSNSAKSNRTEKQKKWLENKFNKRMKILKKEGITRENTLF